MKHPTQTRAAMLAQSARVDAMFDAVLAEARATLARIDPPARHDRRAGDRKPATQPRRLAA